MSAVSSLVICLSLLAPGAALEPGTQLTYRGSVVPVRPTPSDVGKDFDLTVLVGEANDAGATLYWTIEERGAGQWSWPEQFDILQLDAMLRPIGSQVPSLLYDFGEGMHVVPLVVPLFQADQPLASGTSWQQDGLQYTVDGSRQVMDTSAWIVSARAPAGTRRSFALAKERPLMLELDEPVIMNRGTEYELKMSLSDQEQLDDAVRDGQIAAFQAIKSLRDRLQRPARSTSNQWSAEDRATIAAALPSLHDLKASGALARIVAGVGRDLESQSTHAAALDKLTAARLGHPASEFLPGGVGGESLTPESLAGHVTVLHFWDYRDKPLTAPYGQVGYLEFLNKRHKAAGVRVIGVAVDDRLANAQSRPEGLASIRKLKEFMKLSYDILPDDGTLLKKFGDPRPYGALLPLVVVIDADGKIVHYHIGNYAVDRKDGLKELDEAVTQLLGKAESGKPEADER